MKKFKLSALVLLLVIGLTESCTKQGPAGPKGDTGAAGPQGATGATGPQGPAGSANVIYSAWFSPTTWTIPTDPGSDYTFSKPAAGITSSIINNGIILAYVQLTSEGGITRPLPSLVLNSSGQAAYNFLVPAPGSIKFTFNDVGGTGITPDVTSQYRYVLVPGGSMAGGRIISGAANGYSVEQLKKMPYEQLAQLYHIPSDGTNQ